MKGFITLYKYDDTKLSINVNDIITFSDHHIEVKEVGGYDVQEDHDQIWCEINDSLSAKD